MLWCAGFWPALVDLSIEYQFGVRGKLILHMNVYIYNIFTCINLMVGALSVSNL